MATVNTIWSNVTDSMQTGGTFAFRNGGIKHYAVSPTGRMFYGNQYVNVHRMVQWGKGISIGSGYLSILLGGLDVWQGFRVDGNMFGINAKQATGRTFGGLAGASVGAEAGALIGVWFFGWGAIPGAIIGGVIGGWGGSKAGEELILYIDF